MVWHVSNMYAAPKHILSKFILEILFCSLDNTSVSPFLDHGVVGLPGIPGQKGEIGHTGPRGQRG